MILSFQIISNKKESTLESQKQEKSVPPNSSTELLDKLKNKKKGPENQIADPPLIQLNAESSHTHKVTSKDRVQITRKISCNSKQITFTSTLPKSDPESRTNASDEISYSNIDNDSTTAVVENDFDDSNDNASLMKRPDEISSTRYETIMKKLRLVECIQIRHLFLDCFASCCLVC